MVGIKKEQLKAASLEIIKEKGYSSARDVADRSGVSVHVVSLYLRHYCKKWGLKKEHSDARNCNVYSTDSSEFLFDDGTTITGATAEILDKEISTGPKATERYANYPAKSDILFLEQVLSNAEKECKGCDKRHQNPMIACVDICKVWNVKNRARTVLKELEQESYNSMIG